MDWGTNKCKLGNRCANSKEPLNTFQSNKLTSSVLSWTILRFNGNATVLQSLNNKAGSRLS